MSHHIELKSRIVFRNALANEPTPALRDAQIQCASQGSAWNGLILEMGTTRSWSVDNVMVDGHFVSIYLGQKPLQLQIAEGSKWTSMVIPPGTFWINPEGHPFSLHVDQPAHWAGMVIDSRFFDQTMGRHYALSTAYGIGDEMLSNLARALIHESQHQNFVDTGNHVLARSLIRSFVLALGLRHGEPACQNSDDAPIPVHKLNALLSWIDANLERAPSVTDMAEHLQLSTSRFTREFKRATGNTPWAYVVRRRLKVARQLLRQGKSIGSIAASCGFADQAHLTRLFKQHYGVTPRRFALQDLS